MRYRRPTPIVTVVAAVVAAIVAAVVVALGARGGSEDDEADAAPTTRRVVPTPSPTTTTAPPEPDVTPEVVVAVPDAIDRTGERDVTEELQAFLTEVADDARIVLPAGARYRVEGTIELEERHDLVLEGHGAALFATVEGAQDRAHLSIRDSRAVTVRGLTIEGAHPDGGTTPEAWRRDKAFQHGVRILGSHDVELDRVTITDVFGDLVYVGPGTDGAWSERIWIHHSRLARNGRQGIAVTAGRDVTIEHNHIAHTRRATIDLEPNHPGQGVERVRIRHNVVGPGRLNFVAGHGDGVVNDVRIEDNVLRGRSMNMDLAAPGGERRTGLVVRGNRSDTPAGNPHGAVIRVARYDRVSVRDNEQPMRPGRDMHLVETRDLCGAEVHDNDLGDHAVAEALVVSQRDDCD